MTTAAGQILYVDTVLPGNAQISVSPLVDEVSSPPANNESMRYRLMVGVDAPQVQFLHVLQGADAGTAQLPVTLVESTAGAAYQGVTVGDTTVVFPVKSDEVVETLSYTSSSPRQLIAGLIPGSDYTITMTPDGQVTVTSGGIQRADSGGVVFINNANP